MSLQKTDWPVKFSIIHLINQTNCNKCYNTGVIKISDAVREIVLTSEVAVGALAGGYLNLSAYAKQIHPEVERRTRKPVRLGSIVVALSRMTELAKSRVPTLPDLAFQNVSVKSGLVEIAFDKTRENKERLKHLYQNKDFIHADFFTVTHSIGEISIVVPVELKRAVLSIYKNQRPKLFLDNLCSLTVRLSDSCIETPNVFYSCLRHFALKRINIVEMVSTFTELTLILDNRDLNESFITIRALLQGRRGTSTPQR